MIDDVLPDETTILNFHRLLETHQFTGWVMNLINDVLEDRGPLLKGARCSMRRSSVDEELRQGA